MCTMAYREASRAGILVWAPKLCAEIKEKLMQHNINYLNYLISSTQICLHVLRHLI